MGLYDLLLRSLALNGVWCMLWLLEFCELSLLCLLEGWYNINFLYILELACVCYVVGLPLNAYVVDGRVGGAGCLWI